MFFFSRVHSITNDNLRSQRGVGFDCNKGAGLKRYLITIAARSMEHILLALVSHRDHLKDNLKNKRCTVDVHVHTVLFSFNEGRLQQ